MLLNNSKDKVFMSGFMSVDWNQCKRFFRFAQCAISQLYFEHQIVITLLPHWDATSLTTIFLCQKTHTVSHKMYRNIVDTWLIGDEPSI